MLLGCIGEVTKTMPLSDIASCSAVPPHRITALRLLSGAAPYRPPDLCPPCMYSLYNTVTIGSSLQPLQSSSLLTGPNRKQLKGSRDAPVLCAECMRGWGRAGGLWGAASTNSCRKQSDLHLRDQCECEKIYGIGVLHDPSSAFTNYEYLQSFTVGTYSIITN